MPNYDYKCLNCGYVFEYFQKMTDAPLDKCPKCSGTVKRLIGAGIGPIFKGKGFYQTDYKNQSSSAANNTKSQQNSNSKETSSKSNDTKK